MAPITHIVHFGYSPAVSNTEKHLIASKLLLLQDTCLLPSTGPAAAADPARAGQPYILAISGGKNNSPEPHANGLEHTFVVSFASVEDRDWYLEDPVHKAYQEEVKGKVVKVTVLDFEPGVF